MIWDWALESDAVAPMQLIGLGRMNVRGLYRLAPTRSGEEFAFVEYEASPPHHDMVSKTCYMQCGYRPAFERLPLKARKVYAALIRDLLR
jgi:hypothetical protein